MSDNFDEFVFGDDEPEDAWDVSDGVLEQIANLFLRLDALDEQTSPIGRYRPLLMEIEQRLRPWRDRANLTPRQELRIAQLEEDLAFVRERDENG